jgi:hypothetical protein
LWNVAQMAGNKSSPATKKTVIFVLLDLSFFFYFQE